MVLLSHYLCRIPGSNLGKHLSRSFIDQLRIYAKGGSGGHGMSKYGGCGGKGGDVILESRSERTLRQLYQSNLKKRFAAERGQDSSRKAIQGLPGNDLVVPVPCGVTAVSEEGTKLGDLNMPGERLTVCKGGMGGNRNNNFIGQLGESRVVLIDLKLLADVGLVGFPNAGKSTFLDRVSKAKPKIAAYPFTTLQPQVGSLEFDDLRRISIADLPGLIEGAHLNRGRGHRFLKHCERTKLLLFVVDAFGFQLTKDFPPRSAFQTLLLLNRELEVYDEALTHKPAILAINKIDQEDGDAQVQSLLSLLQGMPESANVAGLDPDWIPRKMVSFRHVVSISAKEGTGLDDLCNKIRSTLDEQAERKRPDQKADDEEELSGINKSRG